MAVRVELGERHAVGRDTAVGAEPRDRLGTRQPTDRDVGEAASGPGDGRVEAADVLVRGDAHQRAQSPTDHAVGEVQQPRQRLSGSRLRVGADELVAVLEHEEPPRTARVVIVVVGVVAQHDVHEVAGRAQQRLGVENVLDAAPVLPRAGDREQRGGLARPRRAVGDDESAAQVVGRDRLQRGDRVGRAPRVVGADRGPVGDGDPAHDPARLGAAHVPEPDRLGVGRRCLDAGAGDGRARDLLGQRGGGRHDDDLGAGVGPADRPQHPAVTPRQGDAPAQLADTALRRDAGREERGVVARAPERDGAGRGVRARDELREQQRVERARGIVVVVEVDDRKGRHLVRHRCGTMGTTSWSMTDRRRGAPGNSPTSVTRCWRGRGTSRRARRRPRPSARRGRRVGRGRGGGPTRYRRDRRPGHRRVPRSNARRCRSR